MLIDHTRTMASTPCCPTDVKPVVNNYQGVGKTVSIEGHCDMYVVGEGSHAIVDIYDIFGKSGHTEQFADRLADMGFVVCVPDIIGDAWPAENVPPTKDGKFPAGVEPGDGTDVLFNWIMTHENTRLDRSDTLEAVKAYLEKEYSITKIGFVGMCWGAKVAFKAANKVPGLMDAVAGCHASLLEKADVEALNIPICLLNSKDEPESYGKEIKPILETKPKSFYKDFPTMHHGWMGTRGTGADTDFGNDEIATKFKEGLADLGSFFKAAFE